MPFATVCPDKAGDAEVREEEGHGEDQKKALIGQGIGRTGVENGPLLPGSSGGQEGEEPEEGAHDLQPEHAGEPGQRAPDRFTELFRSLTDTSNGGFGASCRLRDLLGDG